MYISIDAKNGVIVKTPEVSKAMVLELVLKKAEWILKKRKLVQNTFSELKFETGSTLLYLGERYCLKMEEDKAAAVGKAYLSFDNTEFILKYNPFLMKEEYMRKALDEFYREKAKEHLVKLTEYWAEKMGLSYNKITFKKAAKRWGSCSSKGNIMFNYEAVKLPVECVEYLAVHELSHLIHHNHSKIFWKLVEKNLPDYKDIKKKMRQYLPESP